jgi:hypothetical protein
MGFSTEVLLIKGLKFKPLSFDTLKVDSAKKATTERVS